MKDESRLAFSYPVKVGHISANAVSVHLSANERERKALAELWNINDVLSLEADLQIARWKKDGVKIKGDVKARIVQSCVVTLEPVEADINELVEAIFVPEGSRLARQVSNDGGEMVLDPDGPDIPDTFVGDTIDAGVVVSEQVALAIDPYPRKPGVTFGERIESTSADDKKPNPFAVLKDWKKD